MGIAGIIFAVLGLALSIIPAIGWILTTLCLVTGTSLSTVGLFIYRKGTQDHRTAVLGIAVNVAIIVIMLLWIFVFLEWEAQAV